jgi:integrase
MAAKFNNKQLKKLVSEATPGYYSIGNSLYIRVSNERTGFWVFRYSIHKKRREISFGVYPDLSLARAQLKAAEYKLDVKEGIDPLAEKKRLEPSTIETVDDLATDWIKDLRKRLKYPNIPERIFNKEISPYIGELGVEAVNPIDIRSIITKVANSDRPTIANDTLMYCKQLFRHAIKLNLRKYNPAEPFQIADAGGAEETRSRFLTKQELKTAFKVFRENSDQFTRDNYLAVSLLLTLGVRKGELVAAQWSEFDLEKAFVRHDCLQSHEKQAFWLLRSCGSWTP